MKSTSAPFIASIFLLITFFLAGCSDPEAPAPELEEEEITEVTLVYTPVAPAGTPLRFTWTDPDGAGAEPPVLDPIVLAPQTEYLLTIELLGPNGESITEGIREEADAHLFYFGWTEGLFTSPEGEGNISSRSGTVLYEDEDAQGLPLGLETRWTTGTAASGTLRLLLKHQPNLKSATSASTQGETDVDISWNVSVQ